MHAYDVLTHCPIMPVVVLDAVEDAVPLAEALLEGGINTMEVTLRTDAGLGAITEVAKNVPDMLIGAGTVITPADLTAAIDSGAQYIVTPGITNAILEAGTQMTTPIIPGVSNASTIMVAQEYGFHYLKFFPAIVSGGVAALKSYAGPFGNVKFCPTGGINEHNLSEFLLLDNVLCVGGSWMIDQKAIAQKDFVKISKMTAQAIEAALGDKSK